MLGPSDFVFKVRHLFYIPHILVDRTGHIWRRLRTPFLVFEFIGLELHPYPIGCLIGEYGTEEHLGDWTTKTLVEAHLFLLVKNYQDSAS